MHSKAIVLFFIAASMLVMSQLAAGRKCVVGNECQTDSDCCTGCCYKNKCAGSLKWCPCLASKNHCNEATEVCVAREVQCIKAPCYPVWECEPRS